MAQPTRPSAHRNDRGITLLELLVAISILATLCLMSTKSYTAYFSKIHRMEGIEYLLNSALLLQQPTLTPESYFPRFSANGYYQIHYYKTAHGYRLEAHPQKEQQGDKCGILVIDHLGQRSATQPNCF